MKPFIKTDTHFENPFFVGTVEDNKDPTSNYRVKVRIDILHPNNITTNELPWAAKVDSSFMGIDSSSIQHSVPEVGSKVLVLAVGNDINSLIYLGCLYKKTDATPSGDDYLNSYGIYDKNGNYIKLDKVKKLFELIWEGTLNIDKVKEMNITVNGPLNITSNGNVKLDAKGNVDMLGGGNINLKSKALVSIESSPSAMISLKGGIVTIEKATTMGFTCLNKCILTGAPHVSNVTA